MKSLKKKMMTQVFWHHNTIRKGFVAYNTVRYVLTSVKPRGNDEENSYGIHTKGN